MRRKKKQNHEEVTLNLTAMLDMAFQLLAFFVATFQVPPTEGQITLRLPPPEATNIRGSVKKGETEKVDNPDTLKGVETLVITLVANEGRGPQSPETGKITNIVVTIGQGKFELGSRIIDLKRKLNELFSAAGTPFEQVIIQCHPKLKYAELLSVVEACLQQDVPDPKDPGKKKKLSKLSFVNMDKDE